MQSAKSRPSGKDKVIKHMVHMRTPKTLKQLVTDTGTSEYEVKLALAELHDLRKLDMACPDGITCKKDHQIVIVYSMKKGEQR